MRSLILLLALLVPAGAALPQAAPQFAVAVSAPIAPLPFRVVDAEFSTSLNAVVAVSEAPDRLHLYWPDTDTLSSVDLAQPPRCVSVSPDGTSAVVGHNGWISSVDLSTLTLLKTIPVDGNIMEIVHGGNGYAYGVESNYVHSVNLDTEADALEYAWRSPNAARRHPAGNRFYGADTNTSPADIMRIDIDEGLAEFAYDSRYHGDYAFCGNLWISMDGLRIFTACGNVFRATNDYLTDMEYGGKLSADGSIRWAAHSQPGNSIAVLPSTNNEVHYYTHDFLLYRGKAVLPPFTVETTNWAARGRWIFFNAAGTKQYVVVQAVPESGMLNDYGVVTIDCTNATVALSASGATIGAAAATLDFTVTGSAGCGWKATTSTPWITTFSSGIGDGTVTYNVTANVAVTSRVGTITVGDQTYTVTQNAPIPTAVTATATSPTSIAVTWTSSGPVDHYEVWRSSGGTFSLLASPATAGYTDSAVTPGAAYAYKVRSFVTGAGLTEFGAPDYAHTFTLTDVPLSAGTVIKAAHVSELRSVANALRAAAGLGAATFTDPALAGVTAKRAHILELRTALNDVRSALALPLLSFPDLPAGATIAAQQTIELRDGAQ